MSSLLRRTSALLSHAVLRYTLLKLRFRQLSSQECNKMRTPSSPLRISRKLRTLLEDSDPPLRVKTQPLTMMYTLVRSRTSALVTSLVY